MQWLFSEQEAVRAVSDAASASAWADTHPVTRSAVLNVLFCPSLSPERPAFFRAGEGGGGGVVELFQAAAICRGSELESQGLGALDSLNNRTTSGRCP